MREQTIIKDTMKLELAAGLIIRDARILLVHNVKHGRLRIEPPGGKIHPGEGAKESVIREVREELGMSVGALEFFGTYRTDSPEGEFPVHMYLCNKAEGRPRVLEPDKIPGFGWYALDELEAFARDGVLVTNMRRAMGDLLGHLASKRGAP